MRSVAPPSNAVTSRPMAPRVLLVGEIGMRLEVEFIGAGLACTVAPTAAAGVGWMRQSPFPVVVVPATLPDMTGNAFARGLLQHFPDVIVLMYGGAIDDHLEPFVKDGRVVPVPEQTSISSVADYLRRRIASKAPAAIAAVEPPELEPIGPAPALSPKPGSVLPRAKTSAPVPVVMLQADDDADEQVKQATQQIVDLQARIGAAEWALGKEKQARADVDRALFDARDQLKRAQQTLQDTAQAGSAAQGAAAKAATDAIVRERDEAQAARDNAQRERDAIAAGRDAIANERDKFAAERDELRAQNDAKQNALDEVRASVLGLEAEREDLRRRVGAVSGQTSMLQAQLDDERIAHGQARGELDRLRADLVEIQKAASAAGDAKTRAAAETATARADLAEARAQTDALSVQLDAERRGRVADADTHKLALASLDVKVANHAEALRRVAVDLKAQMDETKSAKAETEAAKVRIKELEEGLASATASAQAAFEGNKLTDHDKRKLEARTTEMAREVEEAKRKAEEAREEMFQARQQRDDAELHNADLEIQIVDLKSALETTRTDLATAQTKITELATHVEELRTAGGRNNAELQAIESRLDAVTRDRDRALSALTDASRKLMELEDERQAAS